MKKIYAIMLPAVAAVMIGLSFAVPKSSVYYVELGDKVSSSPRDYLIGFMLDNVQMDVSGVDSSQVGSYEAYAKSRVFSYRLPVKVRDTTPPVIEMPDGPIYIAAGREYEPAQFVNRIFDVSGEVDSHITVDGSTLDSVSFSDVGDYTAVIDASDQWGNRSTQSISFTVDEAPVIIGAFDRHVAVGTPFDGTNVVAADKTDGILSDRMVIHSGGYDPNTVGEYEITYSVTDDYGLETVKSVTLSVVPQRELKDFDDQISLTVPEVALLCDLEYFSYQPLEEENADEATALIEPTLIDLKRVWNNGSWAAGSGAIYRITPEFVSLLSVEHVTKEVGQDCNIMFFNGEVLSGSFQYVTSDKKNEMVMFALRTTDIPADTLLALRQLYVNPDIYDTLAPGDKVVAYAKHWNGGSQDLIRPMEIKKMTSSIKEFGFVDSLLETTNNVTSGMSGTAVIDAKGNLVGLASATGPDSTGARTYSSYHSKIDVLPELWQKLEDSFA